MKAEALPDFEEALSELDHCYGDLDMMVADCEESVEELAVAAGDTSAGLSWCQETFQSRLTIPADLTAETRPREVEPRAGSGSFGEQVADSETFDQPKAEINYFK